jgi:hypothetical protein
MLSVLWLAFGSLLRIFRNRRDLISFLTIDSVDCIIDTTGPPKTISFC